MSLSALSQWFTANETLLTALVAALTLIGFLWAFFRQLVKLVQTIIELLRAAYYTLSAAIWRWNGGEFTSLCKELRPLLAENGRIFRDFGPTSMNDCAKNIK
jgi:hypothetical protein